MADCRVITVASPRLGRRIADPGRRAGDCVAIVVLAIVALVLLHRPASADDGLKAWLDGLWKDAKAAGITRKTFDTAFRGVTLDRSLPDLDIARPKKKREPVIAEFDRPPGRYMKERYIASLAKRGRKLAVKWKSTLDAIERKYGVSRYVLLAIWGRETVFGRVKIPHDTIRALMTQAYLGRRKRFFRKELLLALRILQDGHIPRKQMRSSWAGAMGQTQFMPSFFMEHAIDFDGDGRRNIWTSVPDALASTAKFLVGKGWRKGETWGYEVVLPANFDCSLEGVKHTRTIAAWVKLGIKRTRGREFSRDRLREKAHLVAPAGRYGPAFLAINNFDVLKRYNFVDMYALFVGHLADRIGGGKPLAKSWSRVRMLSRRELKEVQQRLIALGHDPGRPDGKMGTRTRSGFGTYQKRAGRKQDCFPSYGALKELRATATR